MVLIGIDNFILHHKRLVKIVDVLGREAKENNQILFYIYEDGKVEKKIVIE